MRWLYTGLGVLLGLLLVTAVAALGWLVGTEAGLRWAAAQVPGLEHEGLRGSLAGAISAERISYRTEGFRVRAEQVGLRAHAAALLGGRLTIEPLRVAAIEIELLAGTDAPAAAPDLPLRIHVGDARIERVEVRRGEARYIVREVVLEHASLGDAVSLAGSLYWPDERFATRARITARGSLERLEARAAGEVAGMPAEAGVLLTPFAPQKLQALEASAGPVDLARLDSSLPQTALRATARAAPAGDAFAGTLSVTNAAPGPLDADRLPVARLDADFLADAASARLRRARAVLHGGGTVSGEATLDAASVRATLAAAGVDLRAIDSRLRRTALHGPLEVRVDGERQWARGRLSQGGIELAAEAERKGETLEVRDLRARVEGGEASGSGTLRLAGAMPFTARLVLARFNPAALGDYPAGSLTGSLAAAGRLGAERQVDLKWNLGDSTLYEHVFRTQGTARITGTRITQADADMRLGANRLTARGAYGRPGDTLAVSLDAPRLEEFTPLAGGLRARGTLSGSLDDPRAELTAEASALTLPGEVHLENVHATLRGALSAHEATLAGAAPALELDVDARLRGGWSRERGWAGEVLSLRNTGTYPLELLAPAALRVAPSRIEVGRLEASLGEGRLRVQELAWSPGRLASSGEFAGLPAQWLVLAAGLGERFSATLLLDGEWQLVHADQTQGFARARRSSGDLAVTGHEPIDLGLERAALEARFDAGRATARAEVATRVAKLTMDGEVLPALDARGRIEFADLGTLARPFFEEARLGGRLSAELRASGTLRAPLFHGTLSGEALAFAMPLYGIALSDGSLKATLDGERLKLESLVLRGGGGRLTADGTLPLGRDGTARIAWRADKLTLLDRPDMRLVASGHGEASYDGKRASLAGELRAEHGLFEFERDRLPTLGSDVVVLGDEALKRPAKKGEIKLPLALDLRLDLGTDLTVRGYGFDGKLAGLVDLATNKEGELRAFGRVHAVRATFLAYGQTLEVDPGVLIFDGPIDNPALQITAWRRKQAVEAGVQVTGTVRAPAVQLVSQPPVPEGERLSWLVLGRAPSGATQADLGLLQAAAGALLAGGDSVPLDRRIARRFGLDEISLRGTGEFTDRVVAVGKRLSDRVYISYEQGLGAATSNLIKLDYALGRRWTLRGETGTTSGGGIFYRYSWD
jgi:translocation and assembly module TamB